MSPAPKPAITNPQTQKKIASFSILVGLVFLVDAILAYFLPTYIEEIFHSGLIMGLIISTSSAFGLIADFLLPQILPHLSERKSLKWAARFQFLFIAVLIMTTFIPSIGLFILAMAMWGIYYELLSFSTMNFVSTRVAQIAHSSAWAHIDFGKNTSYMLGPLIVGATIVSGDLKVLSTALIIWFIAQIFFLTDPKKAEDSQPETVRQLRVKDEFNHWWLLTKAAWPAVTLHLVFGLIDASFWTIGAVLATKVAHTHHLIYLFLPLYILPMIASQFLIMGRVITMPKEKLAALFILIGTGILTFTSFVPAGVLLLFIAVGTGFFNSLSLPLTEAIYSNLEHRLGVHKQHLTGLSSSVFSVAYIVGPLLAGYLSDLYHEQFAFTIMGIIGMVIALIVLLFSPKKMILPQKEIQEWEV